MKRHKKKKPKAVKYSPEKRRNSYIDNYASEMLSQAKRRSRKSGIACTLSKAEVQGMLDNTPECPILRVKLEIGYTGSNDNAPSLDRKNSKEGYTKDNCWVISRKANVIKSDSTSAERVLFAMYILKTHRKNLLRRKTEMLELIETHILPILKGDAVAMMAEQLPQEQASYIPAQEPYYSPVFDAPLIPSLRPLLTV